MTIKKKKRMLKEIANELGGNFLARYKKRESKYPEEDLQKIFEEVQAKLDLNDRMAMRKTFSIIDGFISLGVFTPSQWSKYLKRKKTKKEIKGIAKRKEFDIYAGKYYAISEAGQNRDDCKLFFEELGVEALLDSLPSDDIRKILDILDDNF